MIVDDAVALTLGDNLPPAHTIDRRTLRSQLRCQKQIGKAVGKFAGDKLKYLAARLRQRAGTSEYSEGNIPGLGNGRRPRFPPMRQLG
jgi:hypothetical protein